MVYYRGWHVTKSYRSSPSWFMLPIFLFHSSSIGWAQAVAQGNTLLHAAEAELSANKRWAMTRDGLQALVTGVSAEIMTRAILMAAVFLSSLLSIITHWWRFGEDQNKWLIYNKRAAHRLQYGQQVPTQFRRKKLSLLVASRSMRRCRISSNVQKPRMQRRRKLPVGRAVLAETRRSKTIISRSRIGAVPLPATWASSNMIISRGSL